MNPPRFWNKDSPPIEHYMGVRWPAAVWQAVLEQAIRDIVNGPSWSEMQGKSLGEAREMQLAYRQAAQDWIDDPMNEPRRFLWVCDVLNLDPQVVRTAISKRMK
jgi:hypothetical protein